MEAQNVEEREMLKSSLTERLNCATQRYHTQLELKEAAIQQAAYVYVMCCSIKTSQLD